MRDFWYAECIPCGWSSKHDDQGAAIKAAEDHVFSLHRDVPSEVRGAQFMGHVINRTENHYAVQQPSAPAEVAFAGSEAMGSLTAGEPSQGETSGSAPAATLGATGEKK